MYTKLSLFFVISVFAFASVSATEDQNVSIADKADMCLKESSRMMGDLQNQSLGIKRINETLNEAYHFYKSQLVLTSSNNVKVDFNPVLKDCADIRSVYESAINSHDQFLAFMKFYNASVVSGMDTSQIDNIILQIRNEINDERYENVVPLVDKAYQETIDAKSSSTTLNLFYSSTKRGIGAFFSRNWKTISILLGLSVLILAIYRIKIMSWRIRNKISRLELRKNMLRDMIAKTQREYFEGGKLSEGIYRIRTKKFAELMRDIDRQVPLLNEELVRLERKKK